MTTFLFIRHGQSESNLQKRFTGQSETVLTPQGHLQAEATARLLRDYPIDVIYSSDLTRVMQTAAPTARLHHLPILPSKALREIYAGEWEGLSYDALCERYSEGYRRWREDIGHAHPEGGESTVEVAARVYAEIDRLRTLHPGKCVAVFTHATPLRMLACRWAGFAPEDAARVRWCNNASLSVVQFEENGTPHVLCYGYDGHQGANSSRFPKGAV